VSDLGVPPSNEPVQFEGAILPASSRLTFSCELGAQHQTDAGRRTDIFLKFEINEAHVQGEVLAIGVPSLVDLRALATRLIQHELDIQGFLSCEGFVVNIHRLQVGGTEQIFDDHISELRAEMLEGNFVDLLHRAIAEPRFGPALGMAMHDVRAAILDRDLVPMHCNRAAESIRQVFVRPEDGKETKPSWKRMREALALTEAELKLLTDASVSSRHGGMPYMTGEQRLALIRRARQVIIAYTRYVSLAGETPSA